MSFFDELRRRHVYRVAVVYLVVALGVIEGTDVIQGSLGLPSAVGRFSTIAALAGFPIAILLAWVYDLTSTGVERTEAPEEGTVPTALVVSILAALTLVLGGTGLWVTRAVDPLAASVSPSATERANNHAGIQDKPSIVIIPFLNLSGDAEQEFFADGMTEDLTTDLSKVQDLFVIARSSAFTYKGKEVNAQEVGRELNVRYLLEGSVRKISGRARITAQLIDTATGFHVWSERYDRDLSDLFEIQNEINSKILSALQFTIAEVEMARIRRQPIASLTAYESWHKGRMLTRRINKDDILEGRRLLERAIELQPDYGEAYSELSLNYLAELHHWNFDLSLVLTAAEFAKKGLSLSPLSPLAHECSAFVEVSRFRPEEAIRLTRRALELAPSNFAAHGIRGTALLMLGQTAEAIESLEQAVALNPAAPDIAYTILGTALFVSGQRAEAAKIWERVRAANPKAMLDRMSLVRHYQVVGQSSRAEMIAREILEIDPDFSTEEAIEILEMSLPTPSKESVAEARHALRISGLP